MRQFCRIIGTVGVMLLAGTGYVRAATATFTLDPDESWLQLSASICTCDETMTFEPQNLGSLFAHYEGTIQVDLGDDTITFKEAQADALLNGLHNPGLSGGPGFATGNYGGRVRERLATVFEMALRSLSLNLSSDAIALNGNHFVTPGIEVGVREGVADYREHNLAIFPIGFGRLDLKDLTAPNIDGNSGTLLQGDHVALLRVPMLFGMQVTFPDSNAGDTAAAGEPLFTGQGEPLLTRHMTLTFEGRLQGTYRVPEPATALLLLIGIATIPRRRRRR